jgi:hypothetical protein
MKSWLGYSNHFFQEMRTVRFSLFEMALVASLALMCLFSALDTLSNHDSGNLKQLKMAKLQAQQELMALNPNSAR